MMGRKRNKCIIKKHIIMTDDVNPFKEHNSTYNIIISSSPLYDFFILFRIDFML